MLAASFGPEVVEEKASENVKRLPPVRKTARVVSLKVRGVVFLFEDSFPEKDEGLGDGEAVGRLPFIPSATEGIPGLLGRGALHEAVLGRLRETLVTTFAGGLEPHGLEPRAHREPSVEGQPMRAPTLRGRALCQILATIWAVVEFWRLSLWMNSIILGGRCGFLAFW
jgi:hypothetical protein